MRTKRPLRFLRAETQVVACCATTGCGTPSAPAHFMENWGLQSRTSHRPRNTGLESPSPSRAGRREQYVPWSTEPSCPTLLRAAAQEFSLGSSPHFHPLAPERFFQLKTYSFVLSGLSRGAATHCTQRLGTPHQASRD